MCSPWYPKIEPYARGLLEVGDGNSIYWECSGNPNGVPALYVHGGPGSGSTPGARRYFNPEHYRIVLLDQRGCGRSQPLLTHREQLNANTTQHLVGDIEKLRLHLSVDRWVMVGASWGTTLALAYAQAYPANVVALVLALVYLILKRALHLERAKGYRQEKGHYCKAKEERGTERQPYSKGGA